jgi:hypothetical protein
MFELSVQSVSVGIAHVSRCVEDTLSPRMVESHLPPIQTKVSSRFPFSNGFQKYLRIIYC